MKFLLLTHMPPLPLQNAAQQRTHNLFEALSKWGQVDLALVASKPIEATVEGELRSRFNLKAVLPEPPLPGGALCTREPFIRVAHWMDGGKRFLQPHPPAREAFAKLLQAGCYDAVVVRYLRSLAVVGVPTCSTVLDLDDNPAQRLERRLETAHPVDRLMLRRELAHTRRLMEELLPEIGWVWLANGEDAGSLGIQNVSALENRPLIERPIRPTGEDAGILVAGNWAYSANRSGLTWFLENCWGRIIDQHPRARLRIVGAGMGSRMQPLLGGTGVEYLGFQEDLAAIYESSLFSLAPILFGSGTHVKVIESLAYGRPVVATPIASRGFREHFQNRGLAVASGAEAFSAACLSWLKDPAAAIRVGSLAREAALPYTSGTLFRAQLAEGLRAALPGFQEGQQCS